MTVQIMGSFLALLCGNLLQLGTVWRFQVSH